MEAAMEEKSRKRVVLKVGALLTAGSSAVHCAIRGRPPLGHAFKFRGYSYDVDLRRNG
jgi:hypothetical protein